MALHASGERGDHHRRHSPRGPPRHLDQDQREEGRRQRGLWPGALRPQSRRRAWAPWWWNQ
eukprot:4023114-Lingulodinium_polyedra.AAC.1